uniref:P-type conjugative transfer protein TrbL n=1 Tax=Alcaligenes faecalis TaxID=511 RepID=UPI003CFE6AC9
MKRIIFSSIAVVSMVMVAEPTMAEGLVSSNVMDDVLDRFHNTTSTWGPAIEAAASRLFWSLVVISMVWTFGMMALRKADIGEFFAEFVRFTIFTGFFWWLLTNATTGMNIAGTMVDSLKMLGAEAGGLSDSKLGPSSILDLGFELYDTTVQATMKLGWRKMATAITMELLALAVLIVLALISINLLIVMASAWVMLYAGVFFLGFGGSRWTSDIAINYYKTVLGIAAQLFGMVLLIAIGKEFISHYYMQISEGMASQELAVMLVISLILLFLVNKIPSMISGIITGASVGAIGGAGSFGAGAAMGAAMTAAKLATGGAAMAGKAVMGAAAGAAGGASALQAAFQKASAAASEGGGGDMLAQAMGGGDDGGGVGTGDTPFAQAAGFDSGSGGGDAGDSGGRESAGSSSSDSSSSGSESSSPSGGGVGRAAKIAVGTAGALAAGVGSQMKQGFQERVSETAGGKLAASIRQSMEPKEAGQFEGNSLGGGMDDEIAAFVNRDNENKG